jgi:hypothetical protein
MKRILRLIIAIVVGVVSMALFVAFTSSSSVSEEASGILGWVMLLGGAAVAWGTDRLLANLMGDAFAWWKCSCGHVNDGKKRNCEKCGKPVREAVLRGK